MLGLFREFSQHYQRTKREPNCKRLSGTPLLGFNLLVSTTSTTVISHTSAVVSSRLERFVQNFFSDPLKIAYGVRSG